MLFERAWERERVSERSRSIIETNGKKFSKTKDIQTCPTRKSRMQYRTQVSKKKEEMCNKSITKRTK